MNILVAPFVNALFGINLLLGNLGWSVVVVTILIRLLLLPIIIPSLKSAGKMRELQPRLRKLQEKYGKDKEGLAKAQMDLYKQEGINPLSGCLPNVLQIAILLLFFSAFNMTTAFLSGKGSVEQVNSYLVEPLRINDEFKFNQYFLGSDLTQTPASLFKQGVSLGWWLPVILLLGSGLLQYLSSKLMMGEAKHERVNQSAYTEATPEKTDDMMEAMRTQSTYMMPLMTVVIGWNFSLGILLYWFVNSAVMLGQQVIVERIGENE